VQVVLYCRNCCPSPYQWTELRCLRYWVLCLNPFLVLSVRLDGTHLLDSLVLFLTPLLLGFISQFGGFPLSGG
jgi:hypothetical protein